jgi:hypothetical protein
VRLPLSKKGPGTLTPAASNPIVATEATTIAPALVCDHDGPSPAGYATWLPGRAEKLPV